ncbi:MAG TPA: hypothetical protein VHI13_14245 [Candidatus Kapabacteria bacterium]|nr:hypothetical protein [Candidatus Kapabacteria bacterium]
MRHVLLLIGIMVVTLPAYIRAQPGSTAHPRTMVVAYNGSPVYDSASYLSTILGDLALGDTIHVIGTSGKFLRITYHGRHAYVLAANVKSERPQGSKRAAGNPGSTLRDSTAVPASRRTVPSSVPDTSLAPATASHASDSPAVHRSAPPAAGGSAGTGSIGAGTDAAGPARSTGNGADAAAAQTRCRAVTRSGKRCSRMTSDPSGYCWQHRK